MADQVATQSVSTAVLSAPVEASVLQRKCDCGNHTIAGGECDSCKKEKGSGSGNTLQRAPLHPGKVDEVPPIVNDVLRSPGQPLDAATRAFFEPRFRQDFSRVRVHTDEKAAESALAVNALAYTVGHELVFGSHQYQPSTTAGKALLAHELTHAVQQANAFQPKLTINQSGDQFEQEADRSASAVSAGASSLITRYEHSGIAARLMKQEAPKKRATAPAKDSKRESPEGDDEIAGPFLLPEVVITATNPPQKAGRNLLQTSGSSSSLNVSDVTFVKVEKVEDLQQRLSKLNQQAELELQREEEEFQNAARRAQQQHEATMVYDTSPEAGLKAKQDENKKAQDELKRVFGDGWGMFFWWTRGGGQTGEGSPVWEVIKAVSVFNRAYPPQAYPKAPRVFRPDRLPDIPKTEMMMLPANKR